MRSKSAYPYCIVNFDFQTPPLKVVVGLSAISRFEEFIENRFVFTLSGISWDITKATESNRYESFDHIGVAAIISDMAKRYSLKGIWSLVCPEPYLYIEAEISDLIRFIPYIENLSEEELDDGMDPPINDDYWLFNQKTGAFIEVTHENKIFLFLETPAKQLL